MNPIRAWLLPTLAAALVAAGLLSGLAPAQAAPSPDVVAVIGDFGSGSAPEGHVARQVAKVNPRAVITVGDNVYSNSGYADLVGRYYPRWVARHTMFPATGNHDYAEGIGAFDRYFSWLGGRRTYATTVGSITFFVLDSQAALDSSSQMAQQRAWLQKALSASPAPWKVVVLHHPPYSSGTVHGSTAAFQWPYKAWGADLVLSGHEHNYERVVKAGLTYVVDGSGGKDLYPLGRPINGSVAHDDTHYGALLLRPGAKALEGQFLTAAGRVTDRFSVRR